MSFYPLTSGNREAMTEKLLERTGYFVDFLYVEKIECSMGENRV
jgi:hypothetical protein